tara:strand:+ start:409 stop:666 length:258 start_codon:yes stop_codon:yes gene_type:complete
MSIEYEEGKKYLCYFKSSKYPTILIRKRDGWYDGDRSFIEPKHVAEIPPHDWGKEITRLNKRAVVLSGYNRMRERQVGKLRKEIS